MLSIPLRNVLLTLLLTSVFALGGCTTVLESRLEQKEPYHVKSCRVQVVAGKFSQWPAANDYAAKLGHALEAALKKRGFATEYRDLTLSERAAQRADPTQDFTVFTVFPDSVVMQTQYGATMPNGNSLYVLTVSDSATGKSVAYYKVIVRTGANNFKSEDGGFRDAANDFVEKCITKDGVVVAGQP